MSFGQSDPDKLNVIIAKYEIDYSPTRALKLKRLGLKPLIYR